MKKKSKLLEAIDELGITLDAPTELNVKMKEGLARMFSDAGIRAYLENAVKVSNRNLVKSLDNGELDRATYYANRIETIVALLTIGKNWYNNLNELKELKIKVEQKYQTNTK